MAYVAAIGHLYRVSGGHTLCASQFAAGPGHAAARLASKLREGHIFGGINAHEQLTEESALTLVRWLIDGIK